MKKASAEMRQHIIDVARSLMTQKGYTAVGLAEVLGEAGVPKGSFYYYFRSKEEFGEALLEEYFSEYLGRIGGILEGAGTGAESIHSYFRYWSQTQGDDALHHKCLVVKLGAEVCDLSETMRVVLQRGTDSIIHRIAGCIQRGVKDGSINPDVDTFTLAESLYQLWLGASLQAKLSRSEKPFMTAFDTLLRLVP